MCVIFEDIHTFYCTWSNILLDLKSLVRDLHVEYLLSKSISLAYLTRIVNQSHTTTYIANYYMCIHVH
jgi:hypothetical protein